MAPSPRSVIFGVAGPALSDAEAAFFADVNPLGFILFARNCVDPPQVRALVRSLRATVGRDDAPVLIDQEGGRVQRLRPPQWRAAPASVCFGALAEVDEAAAVEAAWLNGRLLANELADLGVTVDCAPVADLAHPGAHDIIGDRAFGSCPETVAELARATAAGLLAGGVLPVIKHIPGHGRATADSHVALPVVDAPAEVLARTDFAPFVALRDLPWAMTAHVVYTAFDATAPATTSRPVIDAVIRGSIGFDGVLISDDLCMRALQGGFDERTAAALAAGCDLVLHCSGDLAEMRQVAAVCPELTDEARVRLARGAAMVASAEPLDRARAAERLQALLGQSAAVV